MKKPVEIYDICMIAYLKVWCYGPSLSLCVLRVYIDRADYLEWLVEMDQPSAWVNTLLS